MSELINNREYRQKVLKELITELHNGKGVDEVKPRFEKLIEGVTASEIAEMEQALIMEGMPVEQIQNLCDVHAAVFKGSIEDIHKPQQEADHPLDFFEKENTLIEDLIQDTIKPIIEEFHNSGDKAQLPNLISEVEKLLEIDKHYSRKENLLFPYLEKYGITAPPKVMWGVDDEIRAGLKELIQSLKSYDGDKEALVNFANGVLDRITEMIFKEENILFPMSLDTLTEEEWGNISRESAEIGYTFIQPTAIWEPAGNKETEEIVKSVQVGDDVEFDAGSLSPKEINAIFNTIPFDLTFVDKEGHVKYFTQGPERIFARPKTVLGREVKNCHPPASVHIVESIVEDLMSGKKDHEDFWIKLGERFVHIRYFAVRDSNGEYLGTMEVSQDIKPIQEITGEKRLLNSEE